MIERWSTREVLERLETAPAVCLLGPRQVGKTTLARQVASQLPSVYLDLESQTDRARVAEPELYLPQHQDKLVVLDEVQRAPEIFRALRGLIDRGRQAALFAQGAGAPPSSATQFVSPAPRDVGRFLLLGSASLDLLSQTAESLAGRLSYVELNPLDILEVGADRADTLWVRGGFPESFLALDDAASWRWRQDFLRTYLERDIPQLGPRIPAEILRRFWTMLAHRQGSPFNAADLARGLGVSGRTVARYLDLMVDLLLVRRLSPWHGNVGKRLVRAPKVYLRDTGLAHALLGLRDRDAVLGHPAVGGSYEAFVIETLCHLAPQGTAVAYFRTSAGAEVDLVLTLPGGRRWAVEVKHSLNPKPTRGFYTALTDLAAHEAWVVYPGYEAYPITRHGDLVVHATPLHHLATRLAALR